MGNENNALVWRIKKSTHKLLEYIDKNGFEGYDPYDALISPYLRNRKSKFIRLAATVFFRRSPINLRKLLKVKRSINPKGMGLFLTAYSRLYRIKIIESLDKAVDIFDWLCENYSKGYRGYSWGYNFDWQNKTRLLKAWIPSAVGTAYVGHGILDYYDVAKEKKALTVARSACDFIVNDLNRTEKDYGICFSYTPVEKNIAHNANILAASLLARVYSYTKENLLLDLATKAVDFTIRHQHKDGRWDYSIYPDTWTSRVQTDWHQGFILDSLLWYVGATKPKDSKYIESIKLGSEFYKKQFTPEGMGYWRYPRLWPVNIHNQAQGIITFSRLDKHIKDSINIAERIAGWTIKNLQSPEGYFYYQKHRLFTNKISYIRWGQAWMIYALSWYLWRTC